MSAARPQRIGETVETYLEWRKARGYAESTMKTDNRILRRFARDMRDIQMRNLRPSHVENWFYGPGGLTRAHKGDNYGTNIMAPITPATHNQYRSRLAVFFEWTTKRGLTRHDMLEDVPFQKVPKRERIRPAPDVLLRFLDSTDIPRDRAYLAIAVNSALRTSEIRRMLVGDVDFDYGFIKVRISKGGGEDLLPMTQDLEVELRRWFEAYEKEIGRPLQDSDYLLPLLTAQRFSHYETDPETGKRVLRLTPRVLDPSKPIKERTEYIVKRALEQVGLPTRYEGTHTIRRAVARAYFDQMSQTGGYDSALRATSALLHHSSTLTTERYLGLSVERTRRDKMMRGKPFLTAMLQQTPETEPQPV
jgi:integrase